MRESFAVVQALHLHFPAHFEQPGAHAVADAITEGHACSGGACREILEVGGNDGDAFVVVTGVEDHRHGVPNPVGGLDRAEIVEDEDFGVEDRFQDLQFGGRGLRIPGVLNVFEQLLIIAEEAVAALLLNQHFEDADGEVTSRTPLDSKGEAIGTLGVDYSHAFNKSTVLSNTLQVESGTLNTNINDKIALTVKMSEKLSLSVGYGFLDNTKPTPPTKKIDTVATVNLVFAF